MKELFWQRFDLAEMCGKNTIIGVAESSFDEYKDNIEGLTWLVMVINHKSWDQHRRGNSELRELYADLYYKYYGEAIDYLKKKNNENDIRYFIRTLD